jgi:hypothetical protein
MREISSPGYGTYAPGAKSVSRSSNGPKASRAFSSCHNAGSWSARSPGSAVTVAYPRTTNT